MSHAYAIIFQSPPAVPIGMVLSPEFERYYRFVQGLPRGFQHCLAMRRSLAGWIIVDPLLQGLRVIEAPEDDPAADQLVQHTIAMRAVEGGGAVVLVLPDNEPQVPMLGKQYTCATVIAGLAGVRDFRGATPKQLFDHLMTTKQGVLTHGGAEKFTVPDGPALT